MAASRGTCPPGRRGVDEEERARHLALAAEGPDAAVAAALDEAAPYALGRGAPAAGGGALRDRGGADAARRSARRGADGASRPPKRIASPVTATVRARSSTSCWPRCRPGQQRADVLFALARVRRADLPTMARWCESALAEAGDDHRRAAEILAYLSWIVCSRAASATPSRTPARHLRTPSAWTTTSWSRAGSRE